MAVDVEVEVDALEVEVGAEAVALLRPAISGNKVVVDLMADQEADTEALVEAMVVQVDMAVTAVEAIMAAMAVPGEIIRPLELVLAVTVAAAVAVAATEIQDNLGGKSNLRHLRRSLAFLLPRYNTNGEKFFFEDSALSSSYLTVQMHMSGIKRGYGLKGF